MLAALGIHVRLFRSVAPTPLGAYAVKTLGTSAGIVVTASHNPPEFNGYKVYQHGGTQINTPVDGLIAASIARVAGEDAGPQCMSLQDAEGAGLLTYLGEETFAKYIDDVVGYFHPDASSSAAKQRAQLRIAYTPLHGVGAQIAEPILRRAGFEQVWTVAEQREPDGNFPTVQFPNPEEKGAMDLVHALADAHAAHIAIANDPDADRLSVSARDARGEMRQLSGDQIGAILGDYLVRRRTETQPASSSSSSPSPPPRDSWLLSTIVSSRLLARLANHEAGGSTSHRETLTGFKWLGAVAALKGPDSFTFAYEEALGYMVTPLVWDKDGLSAALLLALLASELHARGETLWTRLEEIHRRVGVSVTFPRTIRLKPGGITGDGIMKRLRARLPTEIASRRVVLTDDLLTHGEHDDIPKNDVLRFYVGDENEGEDAKSPPPSPSTVALTQPRIIIRPSGTEPKVKIYCESKIAPLAEGADYQQELDRLTRELDVIADGFVDMCARE